MSHHKFQRDLQADLDRLQRLLKRAGLNPAHPDPEHLRILDLACGNCLEAELLADHFAGPRHKASLVGVDVRAREIADARRRTETYLKTLALKHGDATADKRSFEFLTADATAVSGHRELGDEFDVVFLRHQNFWHDSQIWHAIFQEALQKLSPGGELVITSYFDREHELAVEAIRKLGGELVTSIAHEAARALPSPGKAIDKHLAVFKRP